MRATGLQGDASIDIIEIIDDGTDVFGDRAPTTTIHDAGGPRWVGPAAAIALIAIIGYGVATSASEPGAPKVAPAPSTSVPASTIPAPATTLAKPLVPYYAADPPRELTVNDASIQDPQDNYYGPSNYQLWAKPGAGAATGSWFSVESYPGAGPGTFALDAYRMQIEKLSLAISRTDGGQTLTQFSPAGHETVNMTSFGLNDDEIVRIAQDIRVVRNLVQFSDTAVVNGYDMISMQQPWAVVQGIPVENVQYQDGNNPFGGFGIIVSQRHQGNPSGSDINRQTALRFLLTNTTTFEVDGSNAIAGDVTGQTTSYSLATWTAGDHTVTVSGSMPVADLVAIAQTVHQISAEEWSGVVFQAARHNDDNNFGNYDQSEPVPVAFGTDAAGNPWKIEVAIATFGDQHQTVWQWDTAGFGIQTDDTARITTVVDDHRTRVLAEMPPAIAATAQLQVLRDGLDPVLVPLTVPDLDLHRAFAAFAFSEPVTFTAQVIGPDGSVLANWPAS